MSSKDRRAKTFAKQQIDKYVELSRQFNQLSEHQRTQVDSLLARDSQANSYRWRRRTKRWVRIKREMSSDECLFWRYLPYQEEMYT